MKLPQNVFRMKKESCATLQLEPQPWLEHLLQSMSLTLAYGFTALLIIYVDSDLDALKRIHRVGVV